MMLREWEGVFKVFWFLNLQVNERLFNLPHIPSRHLEEEIKATSMGYTIPHSFLGKIKEVGITYVL